MLRILYVFLLACGPALAANTEEAVIARVRAASDARLALIPEGNGLEKEGDLLTSDGTHWQDWEIGFEAGIRRLLYFYSQSQDDLLKWETCQNWIRNHIYIGNTHDVGFLTLGFSHGAPETERAKLVLKERQCPETGAIQAWGGDAWAGTSIIDTMANLPVLEGDKCALAHAEWTWETLVRPDSSTWHLANKSGKSPRSHQGLLDSSIWTRGQAWATYGAADLARYHPSWIPRAENLADRLISLCQTPTGIPYWDSAATPNDPPDESAGAIGAAGLAKLWRVTKKTKYKEASKNLLKALLERNNPEHCTSWTSISSWKKTQEPKGSTMADYYALEAATILGD